jgi:hypothetical protein
MSDWHIFPGFEPHQLEDAGLRARVAELRENDLLCAFGAGSSLDEASRGYGAHQWVFGKFSPSVSVYVRWGDVSVGAGAALSADELAEFLGWLVSTCQLAAMRIEHGTDLLQPADENAVPRTAPNEPTDYERAQARRFIDSEYDRTWQAEAVARFVAQARQPLEGEVRRLGDEVERLQWELHQATRSLWDDCTSSQPYAVLRWGSQREPEAKHCAVIKAETNRDCEIAFRVMEAVLSHDIDMDAGFALARVRGDELLDLRGSDCTNREWQLYRDAVALLSELQACASDEHKVEQLRVSMMIGQSGLAGWGEVDALALPGPMSRCHIAHAIERCLTCLAERDLLITTDWSSVESPAPLQDFGWDAVRAACHARQLREGWRQRSAGNRAVTPRLVLDAAQPSWFRFETEERPNG